MNQSSTAATSTTSITPYNGFFYDDNELTVELLPLHTVAQQFGTPLYVYSRRAIVEHCRHIEGVFQGEPHLTCYAVKANSNRNLLKIIAEEGLGADVGSKGELYLALAAGFPPGKISFSGVGKRDDEISFALEKKIAAFNVESTEEIQAINDLAAALGTRARILLRVNLDIDAGGHAYISTSLKENKFGVSADKAVGVLQWAEGLPHIDVGGVHSHIGSQITRAETFRSAARALVNLVQVARAAGVRVEDLDFGGGYGVQYHGVISHTMIPHEAPEAGDLSTASLITTVLPILKETGCRLSIQPGRSIVAHAGVLVSKVLYRKESDAKTFVVVDAGMNDLIRPSLYQSYHQIVPLTVHDAPHETVDVVGPLCESGDFFAIDRALPRLTRGDFVALMCAGAYGYVLSSNYNARPRPAEVLVDGDTCTLIRERETIEEL